MKEIVEACNGSAALLDGSSVFRIGLHVQFNESETGGPWKSDETGYLRRFSALDHCAEKRVWVRLAVAFDIGIVADLLTDAAHAVARFQLSLGFV